MELTPPRQSLFLSRGSFFLSYRRACRHLESNRMSGTPQRAQANKFFGETSCSIYSSTYETFQEKIDNYRENKACTIYGPLREFSNDFSSLLIRPVFSDVAIKCGDEVIKAHKNILASRSPVFNSMFNTSMTESATGVVTIKDIDSEVVRDFLFFIYSNKVRNLSLPKACGLLEASTKYQVETLKDVCIDFLLSALTVEHALLILQKADFYDRTLKKLSLKFISEKFSDIRKTEDWAEMQKHNPVLALEVCNCVIDEISGKI